ncbi:MAG TPA: MltA domain-containing protein [Rhodocyclaceae bacterium]|jgi:membrane-bound lytic murein transglycosylase A
MSRSLLIPLSVLLLSACSGLVPKTTVPTQAGSAPTCPCPVEPVKPPAEKPHQEARWADLPGWDSASPEDLLPIFDGFVSTCRSLGKQDTWSATCAAARSADKGGNLKAWFETNFQPWQLVNPDGSRSGTITGYYEPVVKGSRQKSAGASVPVFGTPSDLITVDLGDLYPEIKSLRLRGRVEGRKLVPYYSRAEWAKQEARRQGDAILWVEDPIDFFFLQIQGSGQVQLDDGSRTRIGYADQNGHPYRSIGKWLIDQGELKAEQASMQGIRGWVKTHPLRMQELLNANPSMVFFRELPVEGSGPPGAMGLPMIPERSIAVDPKTTPLGAPVWLATTRPLSETPLNRLMLAMDTGGAIRGVVRADFYWGSGSEAGDNAGRMRQKGQMWILFPRSYAPK